MSRGNLKVFLSRLSMSSIPVTLSSPPSTPLLFVQGVLAQQASSGRPAAPICAAIAGLRDLCDIQGAAAGIDWRRGAGSSGGGGSGGGGGGGGGGGSGGGGFAGRGGGNGRPVFRNGNGNGNGNGGGGSNMNTSSMPRSHSQRSFGSSAPGTNSNPPSSPTTANSPTPSIPSPNPGRYQSMFKNTTQPVEDKILNNIILSKLNKFSGNTYNDIRDFLYQILGSGEPDLAEMIRHFMLMVFKKAAAEETYCPLYAKLLSEISGRYSVILEEMRKLQANYLEIFEDVEEVAEGGDNYAAFVEKNKDKRYRQGYSQFLAECAALEILELSNLEATFSRLFTLMMKYGKAEGKKALIEEYGDCLVRMSKVLKKKSSPFFIGARKSLAELAIPSINELIANKENYPSLSPKARFILMDVKDNLSI